MNNYREIDIYTINSDDMKQLKGYLYKRGYDTRYILSNSTCIEYPTIYGRNIDIIIPHLDKPLITLHYSSGRLSFITANYSPKSYKR